MLVFCLLRGQFLALSHCLSGSMILFSVVLFVLLLVLLGDYSQLIT